MTAKVDLGNLHQFLEQLYRQYQDNGKEGVQYKSSIIQIKDEESISRVESLLLDALEDDAKRRQIVVSLPLVEKLSNQPYKSYKVGNQEFDVLNADILKYLSDISSIRDAQLYAYPIDASKDVEKYNLFNCIYSEFEVGDSSYIVFEGDIYKVEKSYKNRVETCFKSMFDYERKEKLPQLHDWIIRDIDKEDGKHNKEEERYNRDHHSDDMLVMDQEFVYPLGKSKFEVCDLLSKDKHLIHVKIYNGASATLGHLFNQGLISAQRVKDDSIRALVNDKISSVQESEIEAKRLKNGIDFQLMEPFRAEDYNITFCILCRPENCLDGNGIPKIPFFAKAVFKEVYDSLRRLHYNVSIVAKQGIRFQEDIS